MDRIKKLKIKKQDGTFSDYIPIGADAENIDTADGESVQLKLNKKPYYYDNVADMKADSKLKVGDMAVTLGYYEVNDGGGAEYNIVADSEEYYEELENDLLAELIIKEKNTPEQFGVKGDGITDDQDSLTTAIKYSHELVFNNNKTYAIRGYNPSHITFPYSEGTIINNPIILDLNGCTIKIIPNQYDFYSAFVIKDTNFVTIKNGIILGDLKSHLTTLSQFGFGIVIDGGMNINLENLKIKEFMGDGFFIGIPRNGVAEKNNQNIIIDNCIIDDNRRNGITLESCKFVTIQNCQIINNGATEGAAPKSGIDIEIEVPNFQITDVVIDNCYFNGNAASAITNNLSSKNNTLIKNIKYMNNTFNDIVYTHDMDDVTIINNVFNKFATFSGKGNFLDVKNNIINRYFQIFASQQDDWPIITFDNNIIIDKNITSENYSLVQTDPAGTNSNFILRFINNYLETNNTAYCIFRSMAKKLIFDNNICKFSTYGFNIGASESAIISNNTFIRALKAPTIRGNIICTNNTFQQYGQRSNLTSIFFQTGLKNFILKDNVYSPICFNSDENDEDNNYNKNNWIYNEPTTGYILNENNNILTETQTS